MSYKAIYTAFIAIILSVLMYPLISRGQEYVFVKEWEMEPPPPFGAMISGRNGPYGIATDDSDNVYASDRYTACPVVIAMVAPCSNVCRVQKFDSDGDYSREFRWSWERAAGEQLLPYPGGVDVDRFGNVYVADIYNYRILKFAPNGELLREWGSMGTGNGQFMLVSDVAVDNQGNVYATDTWNSRVQKFNSDGKLLAVWTAKGQLFNPRGIAVDSSGNVYVSDTEVHRILKFSASGVLLNVWGAGGDAPFYGPYDVDVDAQGNIYVADTWNHRIVKLNPDGVVVASWGSQGNGKGQFKTPQGVAVDSEGYVYVADTGNMRIQKFAPTVIFADKITLNSGEANGDEIDPADPVITASAGQRVSGVMNITVKNGHADASLFPLGLTATWGDRTSNYQILDQDAPSGTRDYTIEFGFTAPSDPGTYYIVIVGAAQTDLGYIMSCTNSGYGKKVWYDGNDVVDWPERTMDYAIKYGYVTVPWLVTENQYENLETAATAIKVFVPVMKELDKPTGVALDTLTSGPHVLLGNYYVADTNNNRIRKFNADGALLLTWGSLGDGNGEFNMPRDVAVDKAGNVYVVERDNNRVQKFSSEGIFLGKWGSSGSGNGQFNHPRSIAVDDQGNVYVSDTENHRIQKFTSSGAFLNRWGSHGGGDGQFSFPCGVAVDRAGNVYVADSDNNRIQKFSSDGRFLGKLDIASSADTQFNGPCGIEVDRWGNIYVADTFNHRFLVFSGGILSYEGGGFGRGIGQLNQPYGITVDDSGDTHVIVYVADTENDRVQKFIIPIPTLYTISAKIEGPGKITPMGDVLVRYGEGVIFKMEPEPCASVVEVIVDGALVDISAPVSALYNEFQFTNVRANHTIEVKFALIEYTITAKAEAGGSISPTGEVKVNCGADQKFDIIPDPGYRVTELIVDGRSLTPRTEYTFSNVKANHSIEAKFAAQEYTIMATADVNGSISPSGEVKVKHGGIVKFTITPNPCYHVVNIMVDNEPVDIGNEYTFVNVTSDRAINVTFAIDEYIITARAGAGGSISPSGDIKVGCGMNRQFTIKPDAGYDLSELLVDGQPVQLTTTYLFTNVTSNRTIEARFVPSGYIITAKAGANGSISPSGEVRVARGGSVTFNIKPNPCYRVDRLLVDGEEKTGQGENGTGGTVEEFQFTNVRSNHIIEVTFAIEIYTIKASAGLQSPQPPLQGGDPNGSISPSGDVKVNCGASQKFTMAPDAGYHVSELLIDGQPVTPAAAYTFENVTSDRSIEARFAKNDYTVKATAGINGSISPSGDVKVSHGGSVTFKITPNTCYHVADVLVNGISVEVDAPVGALYSEYTFDNVTSNQTIEVRFAISVYTIKATAGADGSISPPGNVQVSCGANQRFTISPATGYHLSELIVDGQAVTPVTPYTFNNVTSDHTMEARFTKNEYTITAKAGANGSISPSGELKVSHGENATFKVVPNPCYFISEILVNNERVNVATEYTFRNVTSNQTIEARFALSSSIITAIAGANGSISPSGQVKVDCGSDMTFTINPDTGYYVFDVLVDGTSVGAVRSYTFRNVTSNHTIEASFAIGDHVITASAGSGGSISPSGSVNVSHGGSVKFTVASDPCYRVADVLVNGTSVGAVTEYTFSGVTSDQTIEARFAINVYTIKATAGLQPPQPPLQGGDLYGSISPSGDVRVNCGSDQAFQISPAAGYAILDVLVDGASVGAVSSYTFSKVSSNHAIEARFVIGTHTISARSRDHGSISPSGDVKVEHGAMATFTIASDPCYRVADVLVNNESIGAVTEYTFENVAGDYIIEAIFTVNEYTITARIQSPQPPLQGGDPGGSISPSGDVKVNCGASQRFTMSPNAGYYILDVLVDGSSVGDVTEYTFTNVTSNHTIEVSFSSADLVITASAGANGSISPSGDVKVRPGARQLFRITPSSCYRVADVLVDNRAVGAVTEYTFENVSSNHTIRANFEIISYTITSRAGPNGSISPSGDVKVSCAASQTFLITPAAGYAVEDILVDDRSVGDVTSYTFTNVRSDGTIRVSFVASDTTPPSGSVIVDNNAQYTTDLSVTLRLSASDNSGVASMRFSNDNRTYSAWESYSTSKVWQLSSGDGLKTVYAQFMDPSGNQSTAVSDSITLDTTPPTGSVTIDGGDEYTSSRSVSLTLSASDSGSGVSQMRFSNDNSSFSAAESYSSAKSWDLTSGDGRKTVYVRFRDTAGNWTTASISDSITLDTEPPEVESPASGTGIIPVNDPIEIDFSEEVDEKSISISVSGSVSGNMSGKVSYRNRKLTFVPDRSFSGGEDVEVEITAFDLAENRVVYAAVFPAGIYVWPGDTNNDGVVSILDLLPVGEHWQSKGNPRSPVNERAARSTADANWEAQLAIPWDKENATYADADGNGVVDDKDLLVIDQNWGLKHTVATAPAIAAMPQYLAPYRESTGSPGIEQLRACLSMLINPTPSHSYLGQNYPNPFNPETWIPYQLDEGAEVTIEIYSVSGHLVRTMNLGYREAGVYNAKHRAAHWNGRNHFGEPVSSGIYFYRIKAGEFTDTKRLVIVR